MAEGVRIYNLFPLLAGSVKDWESHLDRIAAMGFNWVFVNPFHATGYSGSLYAVKDYYTLNPLFQGGSKRKADTLLAGFMKAADKRGLSVMMDLVINHTGKDSILTEQHPEWFVREADGSLSSPFAVDPGDIRKKTVWTDLAAIDYSDRPERKQVIQYFGDVVRHYMGLGVRGFRCDAAYKVPKAAWRGVIDAGRATDKDAVFIAENLGGMMEEVESLRSSGFDYLFNSAKWWDFREGWLLEQYEKFRSIAPSIAFPETHDTPRLAEELAGQGIGDPSDQERRYRRAYLFSAVFSTGVMIPMGYEYGFRRRLHVVDTRPEHWENPAFDLTSFIADVNRMKASAPVLNEEGPQRAFTVGDGRMTCLQRRAKRGKGWAVSLLNTDWGSPVTARVDGLDGDIAKGREITPGKDGGAFAAGDEVTLAPGEVRVFAGK